MKTCCFIGHRKIDRTEKLSVYTKRIIEKLLEENVTTFLFGSRSQFDDLCLETATALKEKYPHFVRVYARAEFEYINKYYEEYLLENFDKTYFTPKAHNAGRYSYIVRNKEMIDASDICVFYYDTGYEPAALKSKCKMLPSKQTASGTKIAYEYAVKKKKTIINIFSLIP